MVKQKCRTKNRVARKPYPAVSYPEVSRTILRLRLDGVAPQAQPQDRRQCHHRHHHLTPYSERPPYITTTVAVVLCMPLGCKAALASRRFRPPKSISAGWRVGSLGPLLTESTLPTIKLSALVGNLTSKQLRWVSGTRRGVRVAHAIQHALTVELHMKTGPGDQRMSSTPR